MRYTLTDNIGTTVEKRSLAEVLRLWRWLMAKYPEYAPFKVRRDAASPTDKEG
jgi:hypothetical protein